MSGTVKRNRRTKIFSAIGVVLAVLLTAGGLLSGRGGNNLIAGKAEEPVAEKVIIDCDYVNGTIFTGNQVDKGDFRYNTGCVYTSGAGYALIATDLEVGKTGLTKNSIVLAFWLWIEDITLYKSGVNSQIELSSSNKSDLNEINWGQDLWTKGLKDGWNWVVLKGSEADVDGGLPDFDNLKRFRLYVNGIASSTLKIDRITIGNIENQTLLQEPDWENEKANAGVFKGANRYPAENATYIEVDFGKAEAYKAKETVAKKGCGSAIGTFWLFPVAIAAFARIAVRRKKKERE